MKVVPFLYAVRRIVATLLLAALAAIAAPAQDIDPSGGTYKPPPSQRRKVRKPTSKPPSRPDRPDKPEPPPPTAETEPPVAEAHVPPPEAVKHFDAGNEHYDHNELEAAIKEYDAALTVDGKYVDALIQLGAAYYDLSDIDAAVEAWERGLRIDNTVPELHSNLGNASYVLRDYDRAVVEYREAIRLRPTNYDALFGMGNALAGLRRYDEAVPYFKQAIEARGTPFPDARSNLAWALLRSGKLDEAASTARQAIEELGAEAPVSAKAWYALAAALTEKPDLGGAADALRKAIGVCGGCPAEQVSRLYYSLGRVLEAKGERRPAADAFEQYLRLAPYVTNADDVRQKIEKLRSGGA